MKSVEAMNNDPVYDYNENTRRSGEVFKDFKNNQHPELKKLRE